MSDRRTFLRAIPFVIPLALRAPLARGSGKALSLGIVPLNSTLTLLSTHQPLRVHLAADLRRPVEMYTSASFTDFLLDSIRARFDLLITPPHFAALALEHGYEALLRYTSTIRLIVVVPHDAPIGTLSDLGRVRRVAVSSLLAFPTLHGVQALASLGLELGEDYRLIEHTTAGGALAAVAAGDVDAAFSAAHALRQIPLDLQARLKALPMAGLPSSMMTLGHRRVGQANLEAVRASLLRFPESEAGRRFFEQTGFGGYQQITAADLAAIAPLAHETRVLAGFPPRAPE